MPRTTDRGRQIVAPGTSDCSGMVRPWLFWLALKGSRTGPGRYIPTDATCSSESLTICQEVAPLCLVVDVCNKAEQDFDDLRIYGVPQGPNPGDPVGDQPNKGGPSESVHPSGNP